MVQGVISPINAGGDLNEALKNQKSNGEKRWSKAMLQRTKDGKLYATVRIHLMNWVQRSKEQGPFIKVLQKDGEFKQVAATETKVNIEQYKDSYVDYRFEVPNENFLAMVQMYVEPMNRPVRYFVEVNTDTIKNGNDGLDMEVIKETVETVLTTEECGVYQIRQQILEALGQFLESEIGRKPVILPTILEV